MEYKGTCSVNADSSIYSCYSEEALIKIKNLWNKKYPHDKIKFNDGYNIWNSLKSKMKNTCDNERCWLNKKFISSGLPSEIYNYTFAPDEPTDWKENKWLSTEDIDIVMNHYEKKYKDFSFLGPSPINFDEKDEDGDYVWEELYNFDIKKYLKKGKKNIGFVFNTDRHDGEGEHWVSMLIQLKKDPFIFYFDSTGNNPPIEIKNFIEKVKKQFEELNIDISIIQNKVKHQKKNTECGIYCIFMITNLIQDKLTYKNLCDKKNIISDNKMKEYRKVFYSIQ